MSRTRVWSLGAVGAALLLVIAGWFALISPQRSEAASLREQAVSQASFNDQIRLKTQQLKAQFTSLPEREAQLAQIRQEMPDNPALPALIRDLSKNAAAAGVTLDAVTPAAPTPLVAANGTTTTTSAASAPIESIQTNLTVSGTYAELTLYLQKLQSTMRRAYLVENLTLALGQGPADAAADGGTSSTPASTSSALTMTIDGKVFMLGAAASGPAPSAPTTTSPAN